VLSLQGFLFQESLYARILQRNTTIINITNNPDNKSEYKNVNNNDVCKENRHSKVTPFLKNYDWGYSITQKN